MGSGVCIHVCCSLIRGDLRKEYEEGNQHSKDVKKINET
jgi:hypothetical protein